MLKLTVRPALEELRIETPQGPIIVQVNARYRTPVGIQAPRSFHISRGPRKDYSRAPALAHGGSNPPGSP